MRDDVRRAVAAMSDLGTPMNALSGPFVALLPLSGASVATMGRLLSSETIAMSDGRAGRIDELQFDLREGPCWDALDSGEPVLEEDLRGRPPQHWPAFSEAILREEVGAIFAFPLVFGPFELGAVDMYSTAATPMTPEVLEDASALTGAVPRRVLHRALLSLDDDGATLDSGPYSRRIVHQATGMVLAQVDVTPEDAELLIRGHAFASQRSMRAVAEDILSGRLRFLTNGGLIEESA